MQRARIALFLIASSWFTLVGAQTAPAPAAPVAGVQSQNIMDVKPEASEAPGYSQQTNGERSKVQPGNNAPMWRQVGSGVTGYSSLPVSEAPEAGNLIQPMVQYPWFTIDHSRRGLATGAQQLDHSLWSCIDCHFGVGACHPVFH